METLNAKLLIRESREKLAGRNTLRMAVIHTGISVGASLLITLLQYAITEGIANTSGLSGMGTRSMLQTLQTVLQWANTVLTPFWNLGFLYVAMQWTREQQPQPADLLMGFHRVGPCLGLLITRSLLVFAVVFLCVNVCTIFYMMTPAASGLIELAAASGGDMETYYTYLDTMSQAESMEILHSMAPLLISVAVLSAALLIPLLYRFRLAEYAVLNQKGVRAMPAMIISAVLLRRRCWQFFKIDLRLWWYHGLKALCSLILYSDLLLSAFGIGLPVSGEAAYLISYAVHLAVFFAIDVCFRPQVETVYAGAYEKLMAMGPAQKKAVPAKPQHMPWDEQ